MKKMMQRIVLIPAYQPDEKLLEMVSALKENGFWIVVVNDGSDEKIQPIFQTAAIYAKVLEHACNKGKGAALKTGMEYIRKHFETPYIVVTADADGQHKVEDILKICEESREYPDALILGSRPLNKKVPIRSRFGNTVTRLVYRLSTGLSVYDTQTGLRAFTDVLMDRLTEIEGDRYEYEMNVLLRLAQSKISIREVGIETVYIDDNSSSHFDTVKDSWRIYKEILKFSACSLVSFCLDYALFCLCSAFGAGLVYSNVLARVCSSAFNFTLNKKLVFRAQGNTVKSAVKYFLLAAWILFCNTWMLKALTFIGINAYLAKILTELVLFVFSWLIQRSLVFRKEAAVV